MALRIFNTMTKSEELFKPLEDKKVKMFVCGQTVYDDAHLGHAKTYIQFDIIVRWLRHEGYKVFYAQNITDIDDKIIKRANEKGILPSELANFYIKRFFEDMERLRVKQNVNMFPKSMDYIPQIIEQIKLLIAKGYAYVVDGDVYYDVNKFKDYTKLSRMKIEDLKKHRIEPDPRKKNTFDFSLWKKAKEGEPSWDSPWGEGRPGWHIEDTAMTVAIFGPQYDLHGGANELIFPHHTNEIAQAESATGIKPFVKYWLHSGVLNIEGEKMSKSLKNFVTIRDALNKYDVEVIRLFFASTHYRRPINYNENDLKKVKQKLEYLYNTLNNIKHALSDKKTEESRLKETLSETKQNFARAMNDDFNTPLALTHLIALAKKLNVVVSKGEINKGVGNEAIKTIKELGSIFGILENETEKSEGLPKDIEELIKEREKLRKLGDYKAADEIRKKIKELGFVIEDTPKGIKWKRA